MDPIRPKLTPESAPEKEPCLMCEWEHGGAPMPPVAGEEKGSGKPYMTVVLDLANRLHLEACGHGCDKEHCNTYANMVFHIDQALEPELAPSPPNAEQGEERDIVQDTDAGKPARQARVAAKLVAGQLETRSGWEPTPYDMTVDIVALALDAFRQAGVERAEKERDEARDDLAAQQLRVRGITCEYQAVARGDEGALKPCGKCWACQGETIDALRARLSPERLEKVAQAIEQKLYGVGDPDDVASILAVLQRELMDQEK